MPQPFNDQGQLMSRPLMLLQQQELAAGIGLVLAEWTSLEAHLMDAFRFALFSMRPGEHSGGQVAASAWSAIESLRVRLHLLKTLAKGRVDEADIQDLEQLFKRVSARAKERNAIAHATWALCDALPDALVLLSEEPTKRMIYTTRDFREIALRMARTGNEVANFFHGRLLRKLPAFGGSSTWQKE